LSASRGDVRRGAFGRAGGLPDLVVGALGGDAILLVRVGGVVVAAVGAGGVVAVVADRSFIRSLSTVLGFSNTGTTPVSFACTSAILFFLSSIFIT